MNELRERKDAPLLDLLGGRALRSHDFVTVSARLAERTRPRTILKDDVDRNVRVLRHLSASRIMRFSSGATGEPSPTKSALSAMPTKKAEQGRCSRKGR